MVCLYRCSLMKRVREPSIWCRLGDHLHRGAMPPRPLLDRSHRPHGALLVLRDTADSKWATERTPPQVVMAMAPKWRPLYRPVNAVNKEHDPEFPASQYGDGGSGSFGDKSTNEKLREEVAALKALGAAGEHGRRRWRSRQAVTRGRSRMVWRRWE